STPSPRRPGGAKLYRRQLPARQTVSPTRSTPPSVAPAPRHGATGATRTRNPRSHLVVGFQPAPEPDLGRRVHADLLNHAPDLGVGGEEGVEALLGLPFVGDQEPSARVVR